MPVPIARSSPHAQHPVQAFLAARFSPEGAFGLQLTAGVALIVLAALAFGLLAEDVVRGAAITRLDVQLAEWFRARATPGFTRAMLFVTHSNGLAGSSAMAALLAFWFWRRRLHAWLLLTVLAMPGGLLLNVVLKHVFRRARPSLHDPLLTLETYSFPSGHTAAATVFYGLLACWLLQRVHGWPARALVLLAAAFMIGLVALSRMYLGVHYLSDVLAAALESLAWLALCMTAVSTLARRRALAIERRAGEAA
jgi:membrane-associated phospholipid phosphatase